MDGSTRKRLLMLGASGKLGRLIGAAWDETQVSLTRQTRCAPQARRWLQLDPLNEPDALADAMAQVDAVINLAGPVPRSGPVDLSLHQRLALSTLKAAQKANLQRVFLVSSAAVYGNPCGPCAEHHPLNPITPYGRAKRQMERSIATYLDTVPNAPHTTILRIGNVVGADQLLAQAKARVTVLDQFANGKSPRRSYIGPVALARVLADLVCCPKRVELPRVLNLAAMQSVEMAELLRTLGRSWLPQKAPETAIPDVTLDTTQLQKIAPHARQAQTAADMIGEWRSLLDKVKDPLE